MPPKAPSPSPSAVSPAAMTNAAAIPADKKPRKRPMELGDVPMDAVDLFDTSALGIPELSEGRLLELASALHALEGEVAPDVTVSNAIPLPSAPPLVKTNDQLLLELLGVAQPGSQIMPGKPKQAVKRAAVQQFSAAARHDLTLSLRAVYRKLHAAGLRSHEEIAVHLGVNIAEIIHTEEVFELPGIGTVAASRGPARASSPPAIPTTGPALGEPAAAASASAHSLAVPSGASNTRPMSPTALSIRRQSSMNLGGPSPIQRATEALSPLAVTLLRTWTTDGAALRRYFSFRSSVHGNTAGTNLQASLLSSRNLNDLERRQALTDRLRELIRERDGSNRAAPGQFDMQTDISRAVHVRDREALARWSGTIATLLASIDHIHRQLYPEYVAGLSAPKPPETPLKSSTPGAKDAASTAKGAKNLKSPDPLGKPKRTLSASKQSASNPLSLDATQQKTTNVICVHTLQYPDEEKARFAMERALATLEPGVSIIDAPLLLPFRVTTTDVANPPLQRLEKHVEEDPEFGENKQPRTKADRARVLCDGYDRSVPQARRITLVVIAPVESFVPLAPFAFSATDAASQQAQQRSRRLSVANNEGDDTISVISGTISASNVAGDTLRSRAPSGRKPSGSPARFNRLPRSNSTAPHLPPSLSPAVFPQTTLRLESIDVAEQKLVFTVGQRRPATDGSDMTLFFDSVIADTLKADQVASKIHNRLTARFVRPHHCHRHTAQRFAYFCDTCRAFICRACRGERHAHHKLIPHAGFCMDESAKLNPKRAMVLLRLNVLQQLRAELAEDEGKMHALVDSAIDDVKDRLDTRRRALHADANDRAAAFEAEVHSELAKWQEEKREVEAILATVAQARAGHVTSVPSIPKKITATIRDPCVALRLPAKELRLLASVLSWSNPSQYLTNACYPPTDADGALEGIFDGSVTTPSSPRAA
jgi:hypothetical protein